MKLNVLQSDLLPKLQAVSRSCGVKNSLPVLANVLLQTENGQLKLSATNLELGVIKFVQAQIKEEGEITVPAKTLLELVFSLSGLTLTLESREETLSLTAPNFSSSINGISASEFPAIPLSQETPFNLPGSLLHDSLPEISFAAAVDEGRPILTGILTELKNHSLEMVATDGFRLAHKTVELKDQGNAGYRLLIPRRTFEEVTRLVAEELSSSPEETVSISTSENQNQIIFKIGQTLISSRLIEGNFPSWEKIIPKDADKFINRTIINREELLKSVKLASIFAKDLAGLIKLTSGNNQLKLNSEAKEVGSQQTNLDATTEGEEVVVAFNSRFLTDTLTACPGSQISLEFSGPLLPVLVKPVGDSTLEYVVMPVRVS